MLFFCFWQIVEEGLAGDGWTVADGGEQKKMCDTAMPVKLLMLAVIMKVQRRVYV